MTVRTAYVVEDDPSLRRVIVRILVQAGIAAEEFDSAEAFLAGLPGRPLGCVLCDLRLPGMDGLALLEEITRIAPDNPVVMISGYADIPSAVRALKVGAVDFLQKPFARDELLDVVDKAFGKVEAIRQASQTFADLTAREREILIAFRDGAPNKIVAMELGLSPRTVEMHRARVFRKLGVTNLAQALLNAREAGVIN